MPRPVPTVHLRMTTVGIIGAGHIGSALAEGLVARGYDVVIANSRGPETLADLVARLGDRARAATAQEAAEAGRRHCAAQGARGHPRRTARRQDRPRHEQLLLGAHTRHMIMLCY
ncbi:MAG: oxidoreductase [Microbacterium sp.]|nr:oxidoreductase [Microbacterium sp.]